MLGPSSGCVVAARLQYSVGGKKPESPAVRGILVRQANRFRTSRHDAAAIAVRD